LSGGLLSKLIVWWSIVRWSNEQIDCLVVFCQVV